MKNVPKTLSYDREENIVQYDRVIAVQNYKTISLSDGSVKFSICKNVIQNCFICFNV